MRPPSEVTDAFRATGRKVTPQRERIFRVLHENVSHPTAEAVHAAVVADMPSVSLRTVYSTLHELAEMGELVHLDLGTGLGARFDPNTDEHHHLVCETCGKVQDVDLDVPDFAIDERALAGFRVGTTQVVLRGRCARCTDRDGIADPSRSIIPAINKEHPPHA